jgi:hypothetical protein
LPADGEAAGGGTVEGGGSSGGRTSGDGAFAVAVGGGVVVGLVGGIVLFVVARRRRRPEPDELPPSSVAEPVDHEQLLAQALGVRTGRQAGLTDDRRPAWLRRLDPSSARRTFQDPDPDVEEPI